MWHEKKVRTILFDDNHLGICEEGTRVGAGSARFSESFVVPHLGELVSTLLGLIGLQASSANQADLDVGKERPAERVGEVEHLAVVCARTRGVRPWAQSPKIESGAHLWNLGPRTVSSVEKRGDAEEHGLAHRKKRDYNLADQPGITVCRLFQDDQVAGDTFERLYTGEALAEG